MRSAITSGNVWGLSWEYTGLFHGEETSEDVVQEVAKILTMWRMLEQSFARLSAPDKKRVADEAEFYGDDVKFPGFDGNDESEHYSAARFMIKDLKRFDEFRERELNSHAPSIGGYRRMREVFEPIFAKLHGNLVSVR